MFKRGNFAIPHFQIGLVEGYNEYTGIWFEIQTWTTKHVNFT